jgi:hypothetical protein
MKILLSSASGIVLALLGFCGLAKPRPSSAQEPQGNATDPMKLAAGMVNVTRDWLSGKLSTAGTSVEIHEVSRSNDGGQLMVRYNVVVKGAPKDQTYTLMSWPINAAKPLEQMRGLTISATGLVVCAGRTPEQCGDSQKLDDPVDFTFLPGRGEIFRMALVSADGDAKVFFAMVPDPIIKTNGGCSLEVVRLMPRFELVLIRAKGYAPKEDLLFASKSYDESHEGQVKADTDGTYVSAMLPFVKGKPSGRTTVKLKGGGCAPELSFEWGK